MDRLVRVVHLLVSTTAFSTRDSRDSRKTLWPNLSGCVKDAGMSSYQRHTSALASAETAPAHNVWKAFLAVSVAGVSSWMMPNVLASHDNPLSRPNILSGAPNGGLQV